MRILYLTINETINTSGGGVSNKLINKVTAIKEHVEFCTLLNARLSLEHNEVKENITGEILNEVEIGVRSANTGYLNNNKTDILFYEKLAAFISAKNYKEDRIIMRYPMASKGLLKFTLLFSKKIVFEHNTNEIEELKLQIANKKYAPFSLRPSAYFFWLQEKKLPLKYEKNISSIIFKNAHSGACVTTEIAEHEHEKNKHYKTFISSNFYNVKETALIPVSFNKEKDVLTFGMIVTTTASWYGLERLLRSFSVYQKDYKLIIAGINAEDEKIKKLVDQYKITGNLSFAGKLSKAELPGFYKRVHICFGSLGLYTIKLNYASTLKVKESVSFGIPVAIGYLEEDFYLNAEFKPYYFQLPNNDSLIDLNGIKEFAVNFYSDPKNQERLRDLALKYLDVDVKIKSLLENIR